MMVSDNLHRDTDKHAPMTEYISGWIVSLLLVDLIGVDHQLVMIHRPSRSQDAPSYADDQLSLCMKDTNRNPKREKKMEREKDGEKKNLN